MALLKAINKATNPMSSSTSRQGTCNVVNEKLSACQYAQQQQCCANQIHAMQTNVLKAGCGTKPIFNIHQSNYHNAIQKCDMSSNVSAAACVQAAIKNSTNTRTAK